MTNILILDDDTCIQTMFEQVLSNRLPNCDVYAATTIRQAEQWLKTIPLDIAIVDYVLPDGHGLFSRLQLEDKGVKTFFISGFAQSRPDFLKPPDRFYDKTHYDDMMEDIVREVLR